MLKADYVNKIKMAQSIDALDYIYEKAAWDDELTHQEICDIYELALFKAKQWQPYPKEV